METGGDETFMTTVTDITGVILAGGKSSRFGSNKAFAAFQGRAFVERICGVMTDVFTDVLMVTNTPQAYRSLNIPMVMDLQPYQGPLGGIYTALRHATRDRIFVVACDMPLLDPAIIFQIIAVGNGFDAAVPVHDGRLEYLMALYSRRLAGEIESCLLANRRSLHAFCRHLKNIVRIPVSGRSWFNVNTPGDLDILEARHAD